MAKICREDFNAAYNRIKKHIHKTPLLHAPFLDTKDRRVFLKAENMQITGSFKARGAFNSLLSLKEKLSSENTAGHNKNNFVSNFAGVVTRSSGNFARALGYAGKVLNVPTVIVMPTNAPANKIKATSGLATRLILKGTTHQEAQACVDELATTENLVKLSPYDHLDVMIGQGTAGLEISEQLPEVNNFICPVGGGGLMGGCSTALKLINPDINVHAVEPELACDFYESFNKKERTILTSIYKDTTLADGLRAPLVGEIPWQYLINNVDTAIKVSENSIKQAMKLLFEELGIVIEPSGAVSLASLLDGKINPVGDTVCMISGRNVDFELFTDIINQR